MAKLKDGSRIYGDATVDKTLTVGNITIAGNLVVQGTTTSIDTTVTRVEDPIFELGGGEAGAALTNNDGKERGILMHYYDGAVKDAFMGWHTSNAQFEFGAVATETSGNIAVGTYGNVKAGVFFGDGGGLSNIIGGNVSGDVAGANYANYAGTVTSSAQSNITSVGTLTSLTVSGTSNVAAISSNGAITTSGSITANGASSNLTIGTAAANNSVANIYGDLNVTGNLNGTFTGTIGAKGSNTHIQFNDAGQQNATAGFTFNKTSNTVTIANIVLAGDTGTANILGDINLTGTNQTVAGANIKIDATTKLELEGGSANITLDASNVKLATSGGTANLDNTGKLTVSGAADFAGGNFTVTTAGNIDAKRGDFTSIKNTGLTDNQLVFTTGNVLGGNAGLTYASNTLSANNFATTNANITGNITTKYNTGKLLTTDVGGNLIESSVSFASNELTVANAIIIHWWRKW